MQQKTQRLLQELQERRPLQKMPGQKEISSVDYFPHLEPI
jgi:hypothetical protein